MNKYAAEKIASEYYDLGTELALQELTKTANPFLRYMSRKGMPISGGVVQNLKNLTRVPGNIKRNVGGAMRDAGNTVPSAVSRRTALNRFNLPGVSGSDINRYVPMPRR